MQTIGTLTSSLDKTGFMRYSYQRYDVKSSSAAPGYTQPFDIEDIDGVSVEIGNLILAVGDELYETTTPAATLSIDVADGDRILAKIDTADSWKVVALTVETSPDSEDGQYTFKPLYDMTVANGKASVRRDLRNAALPRWA